MSDLNSENSKKINSGSICSNCGAIMPKGSNICLICGAEKNSKTKSVKDAPIVEELSNDSKDVSLGKMNKDKRITRVIGFMLIILLVAGVVGASAFEYFSFQHIKSIYNSKDAVIYQQDETNLKIKLSNFEDAKIITTTFENITDTLTVENSYDNRFVAYLNNQVPSSFGNRGSLFLLDITKFGSETPQADDVLVSSDDVTSFMFSPKDDIVLFVTVKGDLYKCDYNRLAGFFSDRSISTTLLDSDVKGIIGVSDNRALYYKGENADANTLVNNRLKSGDLSNFDLYTTGIKSPLDKPLLIDENIYDVLDSNKDYSKILYKKLAEKVPDILFDVSLYDSQLGGSRTLLQNIIYMVDYDISSGEVVYLTKSNEILGYDYLFADSLQLSDESLVNPQDSLAEDALEDLTEDEIDGELTSLQDQWAEKEQRDNLRSKLKYSLRNFKDNNPIGYVLNYTNISTGENYIISENLYNINDMENFAHSYLYSGYIFYSEGNMKSFVADDIATWDDDRVDEILSENFFNVREYIAQSLPENLVLFSIKDKGYNNIYSESGSKVIWTHVFDESTKEIFFISKPSYASTSGTLYSGVVRNGTVDKIPYIDEFVGHYFGSVGRDPYEVIYQTASNDVPPEYIIYKQTKEGITEIASKTSGPDTVNLVDKDKGTILFFRNYENYPKQGKLYIYNGDEEYLLAENIHQYLYLSPSDILFFQHYRNKNYQISQFHDGVISSIDSSINSYYSFNKDISPSL